MSPLSLEYLMFRSVFHTVLPVVLSRAVTYCTSAPSKMRYSRSPYTRGRGAGAAEVVALQVEALPQRLPARGVHAERAVAAEVRVQPARLDARRRGGVAVERVAVRGLLLGAQLEVVDHLPGAAVHAHREEGDFLHGVAGRAALRLRRLQIRHLVRGRHPHLIAQHHRRRPALPVNRGFPADVLLLAPLRRRGLAGGDAVGGRAAEAGPRVVRGESDRSGIEQGEGEEEAGAHEAGSEGDAVRLGG